MNNFYVYMYSDVNNIPFYIGKGSGNRWRISNHIQKRYPNRHLKNKIHKIGIMHVQVKLLHTNLSEEQALYLEEYYIFGIVIKI